MWAYNPYPTSDELYHWKYISKHKSAKNNWVYVYPDDKKSNNSRDTQDYNEYLNSDSEKESLESAVQYVNSFLDWYEKREKGEYPASDFKAPDWVNQKPENFKPHKLNELTSRKTNVTGQGKKIYKRNDPMAEALGVDNSWITGYATEEIMRKDRQLSKTRSR